MYTIKDIQELAKKQLSKYTGKGYSAMIGIKPNEGKKQWLNAEQFKLIIFQHMVYHHINNMTLII